MTTVSSTRQISRDEIDGLMSAARQERAEYLASCIAAAWGRCRRPSVRWAALGAAVSLALVGTARAANVEYGEHYEQKYVAACMKTDSALACTCKMEAIEAAISFAEFADLVERYDGDLEQDERHAAAIRSAQGRCTGMVR